MAHKAKVFGTAGKAAGSEVKDMLEKTTNKGETSEEAADLVEDQHTVSENDNVKQSKADQGESDSDKVNQEDTCEEKDMLQEETMETNGNDSEMEEYDDLAENEEWDEIVAADEKPEATFEVDTAAVSEEGGHTEVLLAVHICTVCDKKYPNKYLVSKHLLTKYHRNRAAARQKEHFEMLVKYNKCIIKLSPYQCSICRFYFNRYEDFKAHVQSIPHTKKCGTLFGEMQCSLCKFKSHDKNAILIHFDSGEHVEAIKKKDKICILKECHVKSECKFCGLEMRSFSRLMRHIKLKHSDGKKVFGVRKIEKGKRNHPFCYYCSKQFISESALQSHIVRHHTRARDFKCETCGKGFVDKYTLARHNESTSHKNRMAAYVQPTAGDNGTTDNAVNDKELKEAVESGETDLDMIGDTGKNADSEIVRNNNGETFGETATDSQSMSNVHDLSELTAVNVAVQAEGDSDLEGLYGDKTDSDCELSNDKSKWTLRVKARKKRPRKSKMTPGKTIKCDHCDFTVTNYNDLRPHYMEKHSSQIKTCEPCDMIFLSERAYNLHWNSSSHQRNIGAGDKKDNQVLFECNMCKKKFQDENYRNFHTAYIHLHATTDEAAVKENGGSITFERYETFIHEIEHVPQDRHVSCPECGALLKKTNIMPHLRVHTDEKIFKCKICGKGFLASTSLRRHLLQHFGCTERTCHICGRDFKKISAFQKHMQIHRAEENTGSKTFVCETCGMAFYLESQLKRHLIRHSEKTFKCTVPGCHWKFINRGELNAHMRCHEEQKKYLCDNCGYAAHTPYHLRRHYRTHTSERKFHCEYCTYKAGNITHLKRHMRIHIGSKPFQCPYCSYSCNTHENIRKHIVETKKHEGKKMYPCRFCDFGTNSSKEFRAHLMTKHEEQIGSDLRERALTAFTGLYNRDLDPRKPLEGTKIIPLKERKNSRRKKEIVKNAGEGVQVGDFEYSTIDVKEITVKTETGGINKRKNYKSPKKAGLSYIDYSESESCPMSLVVSKNVKEFIQPVQTFSTNRLEHESMVSPQNHAHMYNIPSRDTRDSASHSTQSGYFSAGNSGMLEIYTPATAHVYEIAAPYPKYRVSTTTGYENEDLVIDNA